jgi:predicted aspartyl protease
MEQRFECGQGEVRTMEVGQTWMRVEEREIITQVLFNDEGTLPLLGALALEGVFMGIDPVSQKLIPVQGLMA